MKKISITIFMSVFIFGCSSQKHASSLLTNAEIEKMIVGKWFVSKSDSLIKNGNTISIYTNDYNVKAINYSDEQCNEPYAISKGTWKVDNYKLIITVTESTMPSIHRTGLVIIDNIISIDENNKTLKAVENEYRRQLRTKTNTCII